MKAMANTFKIFLNIIFIFYKASNKPIKRTIKVPIKVFKVPNNANSIITNSLQRYHNKDT